MIVQLISDNGKYTLGVFSIKGELFVYLEIDHSVDKKGGKKDIWDVVSFLLDELYPLLVSGHTEKLAAEGIPYDDISDVRGLFDEAYRLNLLTSKPVEDHKLSTGATNPEEYKAKINYDRPTFGEFQACPVCQGQGLLEFIQHPNRTTTLFSPSKTCNVCLGVGVIPRPLG
jgi:hypothetical protein